MLKNLTLFSALQAVLLFSMSHLAHAESKIDISEDWNLNQWKEKVFTSATGYTAITIDSRKALKASTDNSASVLYREINIDLTQTPCLNWSWRVDNVYQDLNPKSKQGDDFPARIYVVFKEGLFPWQALSLNYVWANEKEKDPYWPNPFTQKAMMVPVDSGTANLGEWRSYSKDIRQEFKRLFNKDISSIHGVAIMADSDNAMQQAISYFNEISFSAAGYDESSSCV